MCNDVDDVHFVLDASWLNEVCVIYCKSRDEVGLKWTLQWNYMMIISLNIFKFAII